MAAETEKERMQLKNRFKELAEKAYAQGIFTFTGFLSLPEQDVFWQVADQCRHVGYELRGGNGECERKMLRFGSVEELGYEMEFPIVCLCIKPLLKKFSDELTHRDFLGALMNLGIERSSLGDIFIRDREGYLFCQEGIGPFICENLDKVKHTNVRCEAVDLQETFLQPVPELVEVTVSSERIDSVIAKLFNKSRTQSLELFTQKKVYVDGRINENNSRYLKEGETVTVRGFGRFKYLGIKYETKKGKICIQAEIFL